MVAKQGQARRHTLILPTGGETGKQNSGLNFVTVTASFSVSVSICKMQPSFRVVMQSGLFDAHFQYPVHDAC